MPAKTKTMPVEEVVNGKEHNPFLETTRKVLLASIGVVALAQDEIEEFIDKLVERGEIAEKDGKKLFREVVDKRKKTAHNAEDELGKRVETVMDRMNVPTKADIETLSEKIATLTKKIDELKKSAA
jgi:poly(hydroxyalkanoate) granule-associated protein